MSNSSKHRDGRVTVCKQCLFKELGIGENEQDYLSKEFIDKLQDVLLDMNRPYIHDVWLSSVEEAKERERNVFGILIKNLNLNHREKDWRHSEFATESQSSSINSIPDIGDDGIEKRKKEVQQENPNESDALRLLGYDPFIFETDEDRFGLFNSLIDYLSEDVLEDGFRLSSVIEIVKTFNQINKINAAITKATSDIDGFSQNAGSITALVNAKEKMLRTALNIAKENGVSVGSSTAKSAGSGTLTGIMKQLQEYDFTEADVNLFDIETAGGIEQVANLSNENIMKQLQFDENDMQNMIIEQRELIQNFEKQAKKYEEENRLLRVELDKRNKEGKLT